MVALKSPAPGVTAYLRQRTAYNGPASAACQHTGQNCDANEWNVVKFLAIACST
jgi:hypothetical protein